jgi:hypothetical protein
MIESPFTKAKVLKDFLAPKGIKDVRAKAMVCEPRLLVLAILIPGPINCVASSACGAKKASRN